MRSIVIKITVLFVQFAAVISRESKIQKIHTMSYSLVMAINAVIACSAILGNGIVLFVMTARHGQFGSYTNRLIRHQSIIDFVCGLVFLGLTIIKATSIETKVGDSAFAGIYCKIVVSDYIIRAASVASTYNLIVISLERFMATCYPVKHRNHCSPFRIKMMMSATWIIGFTYGIKHIRLFQLNHGECRPSIPATGGVLPSIIADFSVELFIPVSIMSFAYLRIFVMLRRKLANTTNAHQQQNGVLGKAKRNVLETVLIAGIMFVVCWAPFELGKLKTVFTNELIPADAYVALLGFAMGNMSVNPVIYCFKYEHFRTQLGQLLRSLFRRNRVHSGEETNASSIETNDPIQ